MRTFWSCSIGFSYGSVECRLSSLFKFSSRRVLEVFSRGRGQVKSAHFRLSLFIIFPQIRLILKTLSKNPSKVQLTPDCLFWWLLTVRYQVGCVEPSQMIAQFFESLMCTFDGFQLHRAFEPHLLWSQESKVEASSRHESQKTEERKKKLHNFFDIFSFYWKSWQIFQFSSELI